MPGSCKKGDKMIISKHEDEGTVYPAEEFCRDSAPEKVRSTDGLKVRLKIKRKTKGGRGGENCYIQCIDDEDNQGESGWSSWVPWGPCSAECGGFKTRFRICTNPEHQYGGQTFPGSASETTSCDVNGTCGMIISGGTGAEIFVPSTGQKCRLPNIPIKGNITAENIIKASRWHHSQEGKMLCGGALPSTMINCLTLTNGTWVETTKLRDNRTYHSSWASPSGIILLGGVAGGKRLRTTEKIQEGGTSVTSFPLEYDTSHTCSINLGTSVILTGGNRADLMSKVTEYNESGFIRDFPELQQGRVSHGCSFYINDFGTKTFLVTGGQMGMSSLSSTEVLMETESAWVYSGELPSSRFGLSGANIDNKIFMTGGGNLDSGLPPTPYDEILEFNPRDGQWKLLDTTMSVAFYYHAVSVITFDPEICV